MTRIENQCSFVLFLTQSLIIICFYLLIQLLNEMKKVNFYVLWSLRDAPRQFSSKSSRRCFQAHIPLPLPKQLAIFGFGEWWSEETTLSAEVVVSGDVPAQRIGTLSSQVKCLTWEGDWSDDLVTVAAEKGRRGMYGKLVLKICGEDSSVLSSTPLAQRKCLFPEESNKTDLSSTINLTTETINDSSCLESCVEIHESKVETSDSPHPAAWPTNSTPRPLLTTQPGCIASSSEQTNREDAQTLFSKKRKLSWRNSQEEICVQIKKENRGASACPSKRCSHTMCLSDPDTAILIGGETSEQNYCKDSVWKLELDGDFWFPMNSSAFGPVPPCTRGHTATFDPDSKTVYVYGGLRESQSYWDLHILDTLTWKWRLVTAKGKVPNLAFHSAVFYKKELFVFGGVQPGHPQGDQLCSNTLYIFNPEHELWYKPIVEGSKPLPRFGHSATLLDQKLIVIFGGRKTSTYLNDLHVLDLGLMEYTAVKCANMPPLPRGFHAAVPVLGNRVLISGGCSAVGALQDAHIFNVDTRTWSSVASPQLCCKPRAGHSVISLGCAVLADSEGENANTKLTLLVFGGSDRSGSFYDDTTKCIVEISGDN